MVGRRSDAVDKKYPTAIRRRVIHITFRNRDFRVHTINAAKLLFIVSNHKMLAGSREPIVNLEGDVVNPT